MNYRNESIDNLFKAITSLETVEDCAEFFEDLCTVKEIQDMAQRLTAASLLSEGVNYQQISLEVGASSATISRVNRCLNYGTGGYKKALDRLAKEKK